jgi:hypothetical protein
MRQNESGILLAKEATMSDGLETPQHQVAAEDASEARQDLAASVVQGADTPQQQQAAAEAVIGVLPDYAKQQVAESVIGTPVSAPEVAGLLSEVATRMGDAPELDALRRSLRTMLALYDANAAGGTTIIRYNGTEQHVNLPGAPS